MTNEKNDEKEDSDELRLAELKRIEEERIANEVPKVPGVVRE